MQLNAYLLFNGNCREAFAFYERTLGAKVESVLTAEGTPAAAHMPPEFHDKILHGRIVVNGATLMASDCPPQYYQTPQGFSLTLSYTEPAEAERIFGALADSGQVKMPIQETFWAKRYGQVVDRFGIPWMVNCEKARIELEKMPECEAAAR